MCLWRPTDLPLREARPPRRLLPGAEPGVPPCEVHVRREKVTFSSLSRRRSLWRCKLRYRWCWSSCFLGWVGRWGSTTLARCAVGLPHSTKSLDSCSSFPTVRADDEKEIRRWMVMEWAAPCGPTGLPGPFAPGERVCVDVWSAGGAGRPALYESKAGRIESEIRAR